MNIEFDIHAFPLPEKEEFATHLQGLLSKWEKLSEEVPGSEQEEIAWDTYVFAKMAFEQRY